MSGDELEAGWGTFRVCLSYCFCFGFGFGFDGGGKASVWVATSVCVPIVTISLGVTAVCARRHILDNP